MRGDTEGLFPVKGNYLFFIFRTIWRHSRICMPRYYHFLHTTTKIDSEDLNVKTT